MKRDDLFTTLHDQYNTFSFAIQDPEAFHHDVYEISHDADTIDDFHRLLADRRRQRLLEIDQSLESLAVEIIANPKLMASEQWQHALQLFRTKSFDSLVRFFASYLPDDYLDCRDSRRTYSSSTSFSEAASVDTDITTASSAVGVDDSAFPLILDADLCPDGPVMTDEPCSFEPVHAHVDVVLDACFTSRCVEAPLSPPESEPTLAEETVSSPTDLDLQGYGSTSPPSRSMSFSGSESGVFGPGLLRTSLIHDDETSQSDCDSAATSVSDCAESQSSFESIDPKPQAALASLFESDYEDEFPPAQFPEDDLDVLGDYYDIPESDTPTPRAGSEAIATSYVQYKSVMARRLPSPHRSSSPKSTRTLRGECNGVSGMRRTPEEAQSKIQKLSPDFARKRPKARIRVD